MYSLRLFTAVIHRMCALYMLVLWRLINPVISIPRGRRVEWRRSLVVTSRVFFCYSVVTTSETRGCSQARHPWRTTMTSPVSRCGANSSSGARTQISLNITGTLDTPPLGCAPTCINLFLLRGLPRATNATSSHFVETG